MLASKTDAKGQVFTYFYDNYNRLDHINVGGSLLRQFYYDTNPLDGTFSGLYTAGRLVAVKNALFTEVQSGIGIQFYEMYSYTRAGQPNKKRLQINETPPLPWATQTQNLDAAYTYDTEGKMTSVNYPTTYSFVSPGLVATAGPTYTYAFDAMSRPIGLTDQTNYAAVSGVQYGGTNQPPDMLTSMSYFGVTETRQYNTLRQLTNLTVPGQLNMTYAFPAGANNGKISSQTDALSGETVSYAYDSLNRLLSASGSGWNQSFGYDGFGNLVSKSGLNSPPLSLAVDPATNRAIITNVQYDANGNPNAYNGTPLLYDAENHVFSAVGLTDYLYDSQGKRIWKGSFSGGSLVGQEVYFYGVDGQKLGTYTLYLNYGTGQPLYLADPNASLAVFFAGKRGAVNGSPSVQDRLGSNTAGKYFPYGEDRGTPIANDQVKFGAYTRDSATGLDYADQRYYSSQFGRFMTADPYIPSVAPQDPSSWNRYGYTRGDPINRFDPRGLDDEEPACLDFLSCLPVFAPTPSQPPIVPVEDTGPDYSNILAKDKSDAKDRLKSKLNHLPGNCYTVFQDKGYDMVSLTNKANALKFWDARPEQGGLLTQDIVANDPFLAAYKLSDLSFGANAYVITDHTGRTTNNVVLRVSYFNETGGDQQWTLVHELLHYVFNKGDDLIDDYFKVDLRNYRTPNGGYAYSKAFSDWLKRECKN